MPNISALLNGSHFALHASSLVWALVELHVHVYRSERQPSIGDQRSERKKSADQNVNKAEQKHCLPSVLLCKVQGKTGDICSRY